MSATTGRAPLRVAFLQATMPVGGAERLVECLVRRVDRTRIEPVVVNLYAPGPIGESLARDGFRVVNGLARSKFDLGTGARLRRTWREERIAAVHLFDSALVMFWAGIERRRDPWPPLAMAFHSTGNTTDPVQHFLGHHALFPVADRFVALAPTHLDFLVRYHHLPRERFETIRSGVDLSRFAPADDRAETRAELGPPADAPVAGIVAALRPEKELGVFVDTAARVHATLPAARFVVVGEGPERAGIERAIAERGLGDVVRLLGARRDVPRLWRALDAAVLTSSTETVPVSLMEAHACGVPAVATDAGSVRNVIAEGETGYLAPVGDAAALAGKLGALLADAPLRARMARAARERAVACFHQDAMVRAWEDLFERLAAGAASRE